MIRVRVRLPAGSTTISCSPEITMEEFVSMIRSSTSPPLQSELDILAGYPLAKMEYDLNESVSKLIKNGDTIAVNVKESVVSVSPLITTKGSTKRQAEGIAQRQPKPKAAKLAFGANVHSLGKKQTKAKPKSQSSFGAPTMPQRRKTTIAMHSETDIGTDLLAAVGGESGKKNKFLRSVFRRAVELEYDNTKAQARVVSLLSGKYSLEPSQTARSLGSGDSSQLHVKFHKGAGNRSYYYETVDLLSIMKLKAVVGLLLAESNSLSARSATGLGSEVVDVTVPRESNSTDSTSPTEEASSSAANSIRSDSDGRQQRDLLRPGHMAGCSPRVFWSLVHHYGPDIPSALTQLLPDQDWTWLLEGGRGDGEGARLKILSEKARENQRQAQEAAEEKARKKLLASASQRSSGESSASRTEQDEGNIDMISTEMTAPNASFVLLQSSRVDMLPSEADCLDFLERICPNPMCLDALRITLVEEAASGTLAIGMQEVPQVCSLVMALAEISVSKDVGNDDANEELLGILQNMKHVMQKSKMAHADKEEHSNVPLVLPFITVQHLQYWINCCKRFVVFIFWNDVAAILQGGSIHNQSELTSLGDEICTPLQLLCTYGHVYQPRDLSIWRRNTADFVQFVHAISAKHNPPQEEDVNRYFASDSISLERLTQVSLLAQNLRDFYSWIDTCPLLCDLRNFLELLSYMSSTGAPQTHHSISLLSSLHFEKLPEFPLRHLLELENTGSDSNNEKWTTLVRCSDAFITSVYGLQGSCAEFKDIIMKNHIGADDEDDHNLGRYVYYSRWPQSGDDEENSTEESRKYDVMTESVVDRGDGGFRGKMEAEEMELGLIVAYLAATDDEPMALWKVHLEDGELVDLEMHEVKKGCDDYLQYVHDTEASL